MDLLKKNFTVKKLKAIDEFTKKARLIENQVNLINVRVDHLEEMSKLSYDTALNHSILQNNKDSGLKTPQIYKQKSQIHEHDPMQQLNNQVDQLGRVLSPNHVSFRNSPKSKMQHMRNSVQIKMTNKGINSLD